MMGNLASFTTYTSALKVLFLSICFCCMASVSTNSCLLSLEEMFSIEVGKEKQVTSATSHGRHVSMECAHINLISITTESVKEVTKECETPSKDL